MREKRQLTEILTTIADHAERATLVQDRSVRIIKQVCRGIAGDARTALALAEADRNSFAAMREALRELLQEAEFVADAKAPFSTYVAEKCRAALALAEGEREAVAQSDNNRRLARTLLLGGVQYDAGHSCSIVRRVPGACVEILINNKRFTVNPADVMQ